MSLFVNDSTKQVGWVFMCVTVSPPLSIPKINTSKQLRHTALLEQMWDEDSISGTIIRKRIQGYKLDRYWNCLQYGKVTTKQGKKHKIWMRNQLYKYHKFGHQECVLCTETEHFPDGTSEMCTLHRNRTPSWWYIRNVYCAQKQNTFLMVHQKCYCAQKQNTILTVHQKCVLCTETEHFPGGISEMCTVHKDRALSWRYIKNVKSTQKQNTFQTIRQKCVLCTETEHVPEGVKEKCTVHRNTF